MISLVIIQAASDTRYISIALQVIALTVIVGTIVYNTLKFIRDTKALKSKEVQKNQESFETLVSGLTSDNEALQLSSAILLRKFLRESDKDKQKDLRKETINVISSMLRILPTSVFQKTLADGLGFATDLSRCDLQKTNLQDVLLDNKKHEIQMNGTDLFLADLSFGNLEGIRGYGIIMYNAILFCTHIRNCDFTKGNFRGADLAGIVSKDCILKDADFTGARNIPTFIEKNLDESGRFKLNGRISTKHETKGKAVFFSMPGLMSKADELITKDYREYLVKNGFEVIYYQRDDYPKFGQLSRVKEAIGRSCGMIAFGFKQIEISDGKYRPGTEDAQEWKGKWLSTPWNEIEVGIGLSVGMPILLVHDPIISEGVFDGGLSECFVGRVLSTEDSRRLQFNEEFQGWYCKL